MQSSFTRRAVIKGGLMASAAVSALTVLGNSPSVAADLPALDPKDPTAVSLGFVTDATKVDAAANSTYAAGQSCVNCQQYQGDKTSARGGCTLFPGKSVPAAGWCKVWRQKS